MAQVGDRIRGHVGRLRSTLRTRIPAGSIFRFLFFDDFNRANTDPGNNWTAGVITSGGVSDDLGISSNVLYQGASWGGSNSWIQCFIRRTLEDYALTPKVSEIMFDFKFESYTNVQANEINMRTGATDGAMAGVGVKLNFYAATSTIEINGSTVLSTKTFTPLNNTFYTIKIQASTKIIRYKYWAVGAAEPRSWNDSFAGEYTSAGSTVLLVPYCYVSTNGVSAISIDNFKYSKEA